MPIYEYQCKDCHHTFEELVLNLSFDHLKWKCKKCDKQRIIKKVSKGSFQLKGSGWAKDGYIKD